MLCTVCVECITEGMRHIFTNSAEKKQATARNGGKKEGGGWWTKKCEQQNSQSDPAPWIMSLSLIYGNVS